MAELKTTGPALLVCGFGRCGSSLVMQMLAAGGMPVAGEWPAFEDEVASPSNPARDWAGAAGKAVKVIDPFRIRLPEGRCPAIWLDRDRREQARSQAKFAATMMGLRFGRSGERKLQSSYLSDRPKAMAALSGRSIECMQFEDVLRDPRGAAATLARISGRTLDEVAMARVVRPRVPTCYPTMLEFEMIAERQACAGR